MRAATSSNPTLRAGVTEMSISAVTTSTPLVSVSRATSMTALYRRITPVRSHSAIWRLTAAASSPVIVAMRSGLAWASARRMSKISRTASGYPLEPTAGFDRAAVHGQDHGGTRQGTRAGGRRLVEHRLRVGAVLDRGYG